MKILIAPDKFKGSLAAEAVADAIHDGLRDADPTLTFDLLPLADGGEGTTALLTRGSGGTFVSVAARDPLQRSGTAQYGITPDGTTAFIEMAAASGLHRIAPSERNPMDTTTAGTGDLIRHAFDQGVSHVCLGIGGSATNDGGMGAMTALGVRFYDATGSLLEGTGASLVRIHHIDASDLHPAMRSAHFTVFCDVDNPLSGPRGAAAVFGPQKGATPAMVDALDAGLRHYDAVLRRHGYAGGDFAGAGAGGGFAVSLRAFGHATIRPGIDFLLDYFDFERRVAAVDLVITGEGKIDTQTLSGKVVKGVAAAARRNDRRVVAVAGDSDIVYTALSEMGVDLVITLVDAETDRISAIANASALIRKRVADNWTTIRDLGVNPANE